jgi:fido (protein-threonine AMPylation protein)
VAFFHPFTDGNARAAMLALYCVLIREHTTLRFAGPVLMTSRPADSEENALALARLVASLFGRGWR